MKSIALLTFVFACASQAQIFSFLPEPPAGDESNAWAVAGPRPVHGSVVRVDTEAFGAMLAAAPEHRLDVPLSAYGLHASIPNAEGLLVECVVAKSPVMEAALQARFPQMQTFIVESVDRSASGRLELAPRGLTAMLRTTDGVWMIDPWQSGDASRVVAYWLRDLRGGNDWACHTTVGVHGLGAVEASVGGYQGRAIQTVRTVRLAVACTGEYGAYQSQIQGHAPNVADPLAAIVTVVARANVVYEADLAVHFNLVANNDQIIFTDPATDPYATTCEGTGGGDCSGPHLSTNISTLSSRIGNANFDIGHVFTRVFGGVAYLSSVCTGNKAGGVSGIPRGGDVDPLSALIFIHEMGHQFGANHTFSGTRGRCQGNVNLSTAWEAGSGSSPMAYAGGCPVGDAPPTDNVVQFADPFFHHGSLGEMRTFLNGAACPVQTPSANNIPEVVSTTASTAIPPGTPFVLSASATDADGNALTYSWEEFDSGVARPLSGTGSTDNGAGALFRVFPPVNSAQRTFPRMADVLSGVPTPGERLPTVTGVTRRFRVCVRDNAPGAGGVAISPFVNLTIAAGSSPFTVISPASGGSVHGGSTTVVWTVGGTDVSPISCSSVTIRLSTDDGATFPTVLGTFPNTGIAPVTIAGSSGAARVRIDGDGKPFFAVSGRFSFGPACVADFDDGTGSGVADGGVGIEDLLYYLSAYDAGAMRADLDNGSGSGVPNGGVGIEDLLYFLERFDAGC